MKTLIVKTWICTSVLFLSLNSNSQTETGSGEGCEDCVGGSSVNSLNCITGATAWFLGGNQIIPPTYVPPGGSTPFPAQTDVGTCNEFPFILKANNNKSVYILPNSRVGIGFLNSSPSAVLDIRDGNSHAPSHFRIYGDGFGNLESTTDINIHYFTGKTYAIQEGAVGSATNRLFMQNGRTGLNNSNPLSTLDIHDPGSAGIRVSSQSASASYLWTSNSVTSYNFGLDASGTGQIGTNIHAPVNLIQFRLNSSNNKAQVWIGKKPTTGSHTDFSLAVDGKLVANSVYVTLQGNWADHVFEDNYQLSSLKEVEAFYKSNHHLPGIPSAEKLKETGLNLEDMNTLLLQKIEELTLHLVRQEKEIESLKNTSRK